MKTYSELKIATSEKAVLFDTFRATLIENETLIDYLSNHIDVYDMIINETGLIIWPRNAKQLVRDLNGHGLVFTRELFSSHYNWVSTIDDLPVLIMACEIISHAGTVVDPDKI